MISSISSPIICFLYENAATRNRGDGSFYFPFPILKKRFKNGFMILGLFQITTFIKIPPSIFYKQCMHGGFILLSL